MALSKSSILHYWSSRYGINARVGGRPVFTRNTAGLFVSQEGELDSVIVNTPRSDWATLNLPNGLTERRKVLTLEMARTNAIVAPSDFSNAAWVKTTLTLTPGVADPMGGNSANTLTASGVNANALQTLSAGSSIARTNSIWLRRRTGVGIVGVSDPQNSAWVTQALTPDWQPFKVTGAASTLRKHGLLIAVNGDAVDVFLAQQDDAAFATSGIKDGGGASRSADALYWNFPPVPQAMMAYIRFVEGGSILEAGDGILDVSSTAGANPRFLVFQTATFYGAFQHNGVSSVSASLAVAPAVGDTVELVALLTAAGAVALIQSINGGAITATAPSANLALPAAWADAKLQLGRQSTAFGSNKFAEVKLVKYADVVGLTSQAVMDELRAFELGPNGDVL